MKLQNSKAYMAGKSVLCNGTLYEIDKDGVADVAKKDAERLLAGADWSVYKPAKAAKKAGAQKAPQKPSEPEPKVPPPEPADDPQGDPAGDGEGEPAGEGGEEPAGEGTATEDPNAWPDPDMSMKKEYLQEMATAYEVEFEEKTTKQELVGAIMKKMYE